MFFVLLMLKMQFGSEHSYFFHSCCLKMHVSFVAFQNRSVKTAGGAGETTVYLLLGSRVLVSVGVVAVAAVATSVAIIVAAVSDHCSSHFRRRAFSDIDSWHLDEDGAAGQFVYLVLSQACQRFFSLECLCAVFFEMSIRFAFFIESVLLEEFYIEAEVPLGCVYAASCV